MKILFLNEYQTSFGGAEVVLERVKALSKHEITISTIPRVLDTIQDYDVVHLHNEWRKDYSILNKAKKVVVSAHDFRYTKCVKGMKLCLCHPRNCSSCSGLLYQYLARYRGRPLMKWFTQAKPPMVVHSRFMEEFYKGNAIDQVVYLPIPLEVGDIEPSDQKENYLFYSARCSYEKNPLAFAKLCQDLGVRGIMAMSFLPAYFKDYMKVLKKFDKVEVQVSPDWKDLKDLYRHARATVLPYMFAEPFGIAGANSILAGTPLLSYPYGNLKYLATETAETFEGLKSLVRSAIRHDWYYNQLLHRTENIRKGLIKELDSIDKWDSFYDRIGGNGGIKMVDNYHCPKCGEEWVDDMEGGPRYCHCGNVELG